jgi:uncharacterized protein (UPF0332 family)
MIDEKRKKEAKANFDRYLRENMLKKERNETALFTYIKNAELSLDVAEKLMKDLELKPYLWVVVCSYYSMFYTANAVLLKLGYKTGEENVHKVTSDALVVLVLDKLKKGMIEDYESAMEDALEIANARSSEIIENYEREKIKRGRFQYNMDEQIKEQKAKTSLQRAKEFVFEIKKLMDRIK